MATVIIHATVTLDGFMADVGGGVAWMSGVRTVADDEAVVKRVLDHIGAVVGGANKSATIDDGEEPYGGMLKVPVYLMTHTSHEPIEKNGTTYTFVVEDISLAVATASEAAGDKWVSLLGGSISRQCLRRGLVDEIHLDVVPLLLGDGIPLFAGLGERVELERLDTSGFADEAHLRYRVLR
ncbi:MAG: dihydrofolate reductase family protein [Candidatus Phosphoribacter sp.]|nr:dihydrofolate reductase family protein [Actinomycetales bacterium]